MGGRKAVGREMKGEKHLGKMEKRIKDETEGMSRENENDDGEKEEKS